MSEMRQLIQQNRSSIIAYLLVAAFVLALTAIGYLPARDFYRRFLGNINPIFAFSICIILGLGCLVVVTIRGWLSIIVVQNARRALPLFALAVILPLVAVTIDIIIRFPNDMNQSFPTSLAFYPSIGFLVEVVFHLVPITMLLLLLRLFIPDSSNTAVVWSVLLIVALIEPLFQTISMLSGRYPIAPILAVFLNLLIFNILQVVLFKRFGFLAMYGSRLVYYSIWHIIWGHLRLGILFN